MKSSIKVSSILSIALALVIITPQANAKPIKNKKAIEKCVSKWEKVYGTDRMVSAAQIDEWEQWCKKGKMPKSKK